MPEDVVENPDAHALWSRLERWRREGYTVDRIDMTTALWRKLEGHALAIRRSDSVMFFDHVPVHLHKDPDNAERAHIQFTALG
jgi:hypothetical protein